MRLAATYFDEVSKASPVVRMRLQSYSVLAFKGSPVVRMRLVSGDTGGWGLLVGQGASRLLAARLLVSSPRRCCGTRPGAQRVAVSLPACAALGPRAIVSLQVSVGWSWRRLVQCNFSYLMVYVVYGISGGCEKKDLGIGLRPVSSGSRALKIVGISESKRG